MKKKKTNKALINYFHDLSYYVPDEKHLTRNLVIIIV